MRRLLLFTLIFACNTDTFTDDAGSDAEPDSVVVGGGDGSTDAALKDIVTKPPRFCETVDAQFCADFDIAGDAGAGFLPPNNQGGWLLTFDGTQTMSGSPKAVSVVTAPDASGIALIDNPGLAKSINTGPSTHITVEADVYLVSTGLVPDPITVFRAGIVPDPHFTFGLAAHTNAWKLVRSSGGVAVALTPQPPLNQWLHAVLSIDISASGGNVLLTVGSSTAQASAITGFDGGTTYPGDLAVGGDDMFYPNNVTVRYFVDNVVARWQ